jgi:hypothetical protein
VNEKVKTILETHTPEPLPEEAQKSLSRIVEQAEKRASERNQ